MDDPPILELVAGLILQCLWYLFVFLRRRMHQTVPCQKSITSSPEEHSVAFRSMKILYHQLHNPEDFPDALPVARNCLVSLLSETTKLAREQMNRGNTNINIFHLDSYSREGLANFLETLDTKTQDEWEMYVQGRKKGGRRDLFQSREQASRWIKGISPVKLVDGSWLGYLQLSLMPFGLQPILRDAWQILSEELGDGHLAKNHVHVFQELIQSVDITFPGPDSQMFIDHEQLSENFCVWNSALAQLSISLFPGDYLPEILGFNLHFELVTFETLKAAKELKEVGLDPKYFLLHVCIDNTDSGHSAIAFRVICRYMDSIQRTEGSIAAQNHWKRIQAGFCLSQFSSRLGSPTKCFIPTDLEGRVLDILTKKVRASRKIHCNSPARIRGRLLRDWLDPQKWRSPSWRIDFLNAFSDDEKWVYRGDRYRSRFIDTVSGCGSMFGAFTYHECETLGHWIDQLSPKSDMETRTNSYDFLRDRSQECGRKDSNMATMQVMLYADAVFDYERVFQLWFAASCLLERFISIPAKANTPLASLVLKVLRLQNGFPDFNTDLSSASPAEGEHVYSLSSIGQEMAKAAGFGPFSSLDQVLGDRPLNFALEMIQLARQPERNGGRLIGMALAFAELHAQFGYSGILLQSASSLALRTIAEGELRHLSGCRKLLETNQKNRTQLEAGYRIAVLEICNCTHPRKTQVS